MVGEFRMKILRPKILYSLGCLQCCQLLKLLIIVGLIRFDLFVDIVFLLVFKCHIFMHWKMLYLFFISIMTCVSLFFFFFFSCEIYVGCLSSGVKACNSCSNIYSLYHIVFFVLLISVRFLVFSDDIWFNWAIIK